MNRPIMARAVATLYIALFIGCAHGANMQESTQKSIDYVSNLQTDCVFDHGYRCIDVEEDDFLRPQSDQKMIPGLYLRAWQICYEDFKAISDLTDEQKHLKHYKIGFTHNDNHFIVLFQGLLLPEIINGEPVGTIRPVFGRSTKYWVDKTTFEISKRLFLK